MSVDPVWALPASGLATGLVMGMIARRYHFCTLSALERHWYADDSKGLRTWVLAAAVALVVTQLMINSGLANLESSFYLSTDFSIVSAIAGGLMFGFGMALVGTCGFGALVRLGGGSLQSLVVVCGIALAALSAQRGVVGHLRQAIESRTTLDLSWAGSQSLGDIATTLAGGISLHVPVAIAVSVLLLVWIFASPDFRRSGGHILAGCGIGLCIAFGWYITSRFRQISFDPVQLEAGSFVLPPGDLLFQLIAVVGTTPDYGVGMVVGVVIGACLTARSRDDMRWEACDDAGELGRHLLGAFLMGTGGVFAMGCTIGQGVSAMSVMALSAPIVFACILLGARLGLSYLLEGSLLFYRRAA